MEKIYQSLLEQKNWGTNFYKNAPRVFARREKKKKLTNFILHLLQVMAFTVQ